jgi:type I restriction enzyme, S subunit
MRVDCFPNSMVDWPKLPISSFAVVNPRYPVKKNRNYPFVEMAAVGENFGGIQRMDWRKLEGSGLSRFRIGDTLFAKITPCPENGKVAYVKTLQDDIGLGSTEFIVLSPQADTDPQFLFYLLCSYAVRGRAAARMEGSTGRQRVPEDVFTKWLLAPKPDPPEQAEIASILGAVDAAIENTRAAADRARELKRAILQRFFYDALGATAYADRPLKQLPLGWSLVVTRKLLAEDPQNGVSPESSTQPPGTPTFSIAAIRDGRVDLNTEEHLKYAHAPEKVVQRYRVCKGDVLIVRGNASPDLVGKAAMISSFPGGCIYPDIAKRVVFRTEGELKVISEYAVLAWNHPVVHNQILRRAKTSNGTLKINNRDVSQIILPVPPDAEQRRLVRLAAAVDEKIAGLVRVATVQQQLKESLTYDLLTGVARVKHEAKAALS